MARYDEPRASWQAGQWRQAYDDRFAGRDAGWQVGRRGVPGLRGANPDYAREYRNDRWGSGEAPAADPRRESAPGGLYGPMRYGFGPYYQRLLERRRPDDELKDEVEEALFYDSWVDAEAISVEVADGVVTLKGQLPNFEEIRYAVDDAWDVDGVRGVQSLLTLRDEQERRR
jgi:hypothetical protein